MAMKSRRKLFERDIRNALVLSSRSIIRLAEKNMDELDRSDEEQDGRWQWWMWEHATATEILEQYERNNLLTLVHNFFNKYPILVASEDKQVVLAFVKETRERLIKDVVSEVMCEEDESGEPRYEHVGDGKYSKNPRFVESEKKEDDDDDDQEGNNGSTG